MELNTLVEKLRFKAESPLTIIEAPREFHELPWVPMDAVQSHGHLTQVVFFSKDMANLRTGLPTILERVDESSKVWIAYPKLSGIHRSDISRDTIWKEALNWGWRPVGQSPLDDNWSAIWLKLDRQVKSRKNKYPAIDLENRVITLPEDFREALKHEGLLENFESLSFSQRREHVESILEAKKQETRQKRIMKSLEVIRVRFSSSS